MKAFDKLLDSQLQTYSNLTWALIDLLDPEDTEVSHEEFTPTPEQIINQLTEGFENEGQVSIPDLGNRLHTMCNLVRPHYYTDQAAQNLFIVQRKPVKHNIITITLSMAFEISAGYSEINDMKWPDENHENRERKNMIFGSEQKKYRVEHPTTLYLTWYSARI